MSDITDYILAKQALAKLDVCPFGAFGDSRMMAVDIVDNNPVYGHLGGLSMFSLLDLQATYVPSGLRHARYAEPCCIGEALAAVFPGTLSDSQQLSQRDRRAQDIRAVNMQAQVPLARVYDFEKPFPEERSYNPRLPETPKILKLRK